MNFHLGCAVWSYKGWVGEFYPSGSRSQEFLNLYSQRFTTVEGNTTFYAQPSQNTLARWRSETTDNFKFCLKLPRDITHQGLLEPLIPQALTFAEQMQALGQRLGVIFAQLPPSYSPEYLADLTYFLKAWQTVPVPLALEVRHLDWFQEPYSQQLTEILTELGIGTVLLDTRPIYNCPDDPQLKSERRKPQLPLQPKITAAFSFIRFISHPEPQWNQPYLQEWVTQVENWLNQGTKIYFFVHCPQEVRSPHTAREFQNLLEQQAIDVPPLPWNQLTPEPVQLRLF